jgi:hypothetical protein
MTVDSSCMCGNIQIAFPLHVVLQLFALYVLSVFFNPFYLSLYQQKPNRTLNSNNKIHTVSQNDLNRSYALRYLVAINVMSSGPGLYKNSTRLDLVSVPLTCSQELATCRYPEPTESSPRFAIILL